MGNGLDRSKPNFNIKENSTLCPIDNYSKNKIISENKIKKIIPKKFLILRISNLIGQKRFIKKSRKISHTFIDNYFNYKKKNIIFYEDHCKDFLSTDQFNKIFFEILKNDLSGTYNVSLGKKVYISEILKALNKNRIHKNFIKTRQRKALTS